ncbi:O-antigen ligase family protein [PVC group bacterium]|nr:O-antigen ligase family protein [PVC group bacterium]
MTIVPLVFWKQFFNWFLLKLYVAQLTLGLLSVWLVFRLCEIDTLKFAKNSLNISIFGFFVVFSVFTIFSKYHHISFPEWQEYVTYLLLYFLFSNLITSRKEFTLVCHLPIIAAVIATLYGLHQCGWSLKGGIPYSTLGNKNFFGNFITMNIFIVGGLLAATMMKNAINRLSNWVSLRTWGYAAVLVLLMIGEFISRSNGVWLGLGVAIIIFGFCVLSIRSRLLYCILVLVISTIAIYTPYIQKQVIDEFSTGVRQYIWKGSFQMFVSNIWWGPGFGTFFVEYPKHRLTDYFSMEKAVTTTRHAHNEFIQLGAEMGIWGVMAFAAIVFLVLWQGYKILGLYRKELRTCLIKVIKPGTDMKDAELKQDDLKIVLPLIGIWMGLVGVIAHNMVSVDLRFPSIAVSFWSALGLFVAGQKILNPRERVFNIPDRIQTHLSSNSATYIVLAAALIILLQYPLVYKPIMSQSLFHKGVVTRSQGKWEESTAYYNRALEYDPVNLRILYRLAFNYAQLNQMENALKTYLRLTSLAPNYSRVQSNLGKIYLQLGQLD